MITNEKLEDAFIYLLGINRAVSVRLPTLAAELNLPAELVARGLAIYDRTPIEHRTYRISKSGFQSPTDAFDYQIEIEKRA